MTQTANNYGVVLYELGVEKEIVEETKRIFSLTAELQKALKSPAVSKNEKHRLVDRIFPEKMRSFLKVVCDNQEAELLDDIFEAYAGQFDAAHGILHAKLEYVMEPTEEQLDGMRAYLKKRYGEETVQLSMEKKPELIGGFVLRVGDIEEDYSMKGRLNRLERSLAWR